MLAGVNAQAVLLAVLTLLIVFLTPVPVRRTVPAPLIALLVLTPLPVLLGLDVPVIGEIPLGLPELAMPEFSLGTWTKVLVLGVTLAALASIDSLLTGIGLPVISNERQQPRPEGHEVAAALWLQRRSASAGGAYADRIAD